MLPVWFFIGVLLLVYGIIILVTSVADVHRPRKSYWPAITPESGVA